VKRTVARWNRSKQEIVQIRIDEYGGRNTIDIRGWYKDKKGDLRATPRGITLELRHVGQLAAGLKRAARIARKAGLVPPE
jgi:hypothetical protein